MVEFMTIQGLVKIFRTWISNFFIANSTLKLNDIELRHFIDKPHSVENYCKEFIIKEGTSAKESILYVGPLILRINLKVLILDNEKTIPVTLLIAQANQNPIVDYPSATANLNNHFDDKLNFHNETIWLLFKPGHYDLIYSYECIAAHTIIKDWKKLIEEEKKKEMVINSIQAANAQEVLLGKRKLEDNNLETPEKRKKLYEKGSCRIELGSGNEVQKMKLSGSNSESFRLKITTNDATMEFTKETMLDMIKIMETISKTKTNPNQFENQMVALKDQLDKLASDYKELTYKFDKISREIEVRLRKCNEQENNIENLDTEVTKLKNMISGIQGRENKLDQDLGLHFTAIQEIERKISDLKKKIVDKKLELEEYTKEVLNAKINEISQMHTNTNRFEQCHNSSITPQCEVKSNNELHDNIQLKTSKDKSDIDIDKKNKDKNKINDPEKVVDVKKEGKKIENYNKNESEHKLEVKAKAEAEAKAKIEVEDEDEDEDEYEIEYRYIILLLYSYNEFYSNGSDNYNKEKNYSQTKKQKNDKKKNYNPKNTFGVGTRSAQRSKKW